MPVAAHPALVRALAQVKHAAALANAELGVLAHLDPLDDVNRCRSTNDTCPTALRLAVAGAPEELRAELALPAGAFAAKGEEFAGVVKVGRTQLRDAVPMTLGREFAAFGVTLAENVERIGETLINLPPRQAGSSVMPGKVNPVIPEMVDQIAFATAGADVAITMAADNGQPQLNTFEPLIGHLLLQRLAWLTRGCAALRTLCVEGITANEDRLPRTADAAVGTVTAPAPRIGHEAASVVAREALATGAGVLEVVTRRGLLDPATARALMAAAG